MVTIAFDTATDRLSVAARHDGGGTVSAELTGARRHARCLLALVDELLERLGAVPADVSTVVLSDGPGSFTGLRVGASVAKALTSAAPVALATASTLLVQAAGIEAARGRTVLSVGNALRGELYAARYRLDLPRRVETLLPPTTLAPEALAAGPPADLIVGAAPPEVVEVIRRAWDVPWVGPPECLPQATTLLALTGVEGGAEPITDPRGWEPVYGRPAEAQARWEEAHGRPLPDPASPGR